MQEGNRVVKHGEGVDEEGEPVEGKYKDEDGKLENGGDKDGGGVDEEGEYGDGVMFGVQICPGHLLTGYDYGLKVCQASLVMDSIISQQGNHMYNNMTHS